MKPNEISSSREGPVEWITFDCYGTLIDWESGVSDALSPFLPPPVDRAGLAAQYIAVEAAVECEGYRPYRDVLAAAGARLVESLGHPLPPGRERVLPNSLGSWRPFPEVPEALRALRLGGYRLAILSNVDRDLLAASMIHLGIEPDLAVTAEDCQSYKPAPGHWRRFQALSGAEPSSTIHVAASLFHDIGTAASLGYRTVFVNRHDAAVTGVAPTRVVRDLRGIRTIIDELSAS
ncbi:MAG TPA: HAD family hydrolase [bacterium]|nr:HAD family hydrolase [bacterium]